MHTGLSIAKNTGSSQRKTNPEVMEMTFHIRSVFDNIVDIKHVIFNRIAPKTRAVVRKALDNFTLPSFTSGAIIELGQNIPTDKE